MLYKVGGNHPGRGEIEFNDTQFEDSNGVVNLKNTTTSVIDTITNLVIVNNNVMSTTDIDVSWDSLGIESILSESFSDTINIILDLDTGIPSIDTIYYIWAVAGEGQPTICLFSISSTNPTLPANYTEKRLISFVFRNGANLELYIQKNKNYNYEYSNVKTIYLGLLNGATPVDIDLSSIIGLEITNIIKKLTTLIAIVDATVIMGQVLIYHYDGVTRYRTTTIAIYINMNNFAVQYIHPLITNQISLSGAATSTCQLVCLGYELDI